MENCLESRRPDNWGIADHIQYPIAYTDRQLSVQKLLGSGWQNYGTQESTKDDRKYMCN